MLKKVDNVGRAEFLAALKRSGKSRNKYNAKRVFLDGRWYDSIREAEVSCDLSNKMRAGQIAAIEYQPTFELIPKPNRITYRADFRVKYPDGHVEIIDVKGVETDVFKIKAKMFRHFFPDLTLVIYK